MFVIFCSGKLNARRVPVATAQCSLEWTVSIWIHCITYCNDGAEEVNMPVVVRKVN